MGELDNTQPKNQAMTNFSGKKFMANSKRSQTRLKDLGFDPIEKLVRLYERLEAEDAVYQELRNAGAVLLMDKKGNTKPAKRYSGVAHAAILAQMQKVSSDLLRYSYGRVPEGVDLQKGGTPKMVINTASGIKIINPGERDDDISDATYEEIPND
jgi:hypothetical protein